MPKTKFQDFIFGVMMVILMVFAMVCYSLSIHNGGFNNDILIKACQIFLPVCIIAFIVESLFVGKLVKKITFKTVDASKTEPIFITLMISGLTVAFMCPIMTLIVNIFFEFKGIENLFTNWLQTWVISFPMALCFQIFYAGPLVRFLFRKIFKKQLENNN